MIYRTKHMKASWLLFSLIVITSFKSSAQNKFDWFTRQFVSGYQSLHLPALQLSYADNLQLVKSPDSIKAEVTFFKNVQRGLNNFAYPNLTPAQQQDYEQIKYEAALNLERLGLEKQLSEDVRKKPSANGIYNTPTGKQWYAYFLKKWVGDNVTPDQIYAFGLKEVERVKNHIKDIQLQSGLSEDDFYKHLNDSSFFINDQAQVQQAFERDEQVIKEHLSALFNPYPIPPLAIKKGTMETVATAPGYYTDGTFYYNLFGKPYNKRQVDWLFIHEAIPGHHYQISIAANAKTTTLQKQFDYMGFVEGWAAYTEDYGKQLGLYQTIYDELGKWEWDIVRSVRLPLDVGINYYGWTDEQALAFWKKNIRNQDDIAMREINRVKRWPAQVVTYKYGAAQIAAWKTELQKREGAKFNIRDFHDRVLSHGSLPLFMVKANVFKKS